MDLVIEKMKEMNIEVPILPYSASSREGIDEIKKLIAEFVWFSCQENRDP